MAHVSQDRGQLILVTGLAIALAMVALVLLLNTAIFTENLASRGADQSGREAMEYQRLMVDGVGDLVDAENEREHSEWTHVEENVTGSLKLIDNRTARSYALEGSAVRINQSTVSPQEGRLIRQPSSRQLENESGEPDWQLASSIDGTRSFAVTIDESSLTPTTASQAESDGAFAVHVQDGSDDWWAFIYSDSGDISVATKTTGSPTEVCSTSATRATIDLTEGSIDDETCDGLSWARGVGSPYELSFQDGNNATGTYNLTVDTTTVDTENLNAGGPSPYFVHAVYSVTFDISYETRTLTYRSTVRVAPGEPE